MLRRLSVPDFSVYPNFMGRGRPIGIRQVVIRSRRLQPGIHPEVYQVSPFGLDNWGPILKRRSQAADETRCSRRPDGPIPYKIGCCKAISPPPRGMDRPPRFREVHSAGRRELGAKSVVFYARLFTLCAARHAFCDQTGPTPEARCVNTALWLMRPCPCFYVGRYRGALQGG